MLFHVLQRLQATEVDGGFDGGRIPGDRLCAQPHPQARAPRDGGEGIREPSLREHRRGDAVRDGAHLLQRRVDVASDFIEHAPGPAGVVAEDPLSDAQLHAQSDESLLCSVVQVALDTPALRVDRRDRAHAGRRDGGLEPVALERERRRGCERVEQLRMVEQGGIMRQRRDGRPVLAGTRVIGPARSLRERNGRARRRRRRSRPPEAST